MVDERRPTLGLVPITPAAQPVDLLRGLAVPILRAIALPMSAPSPFPFSPSTSAPAHQAHPSLPSSTISRAGPRHRRSEHLAFAGPVRLSCPPSSSM